MVVKKHVLSHGLTFHQIVVGRRQIRGDEQITAPS